MFQQNVFLKAAVRHFPTVENGLRPKAVSRTLTDCAHLFPGHSHVLCGKYFSFSRSVPKVKGPERGGPVAVKKRPKSFLLI